MPAIGTTAFYPDFSPDASLLVFTSLVPGKVAGEKRSYEARIADLRAGNVTAVPGSAGTLGSWFVDQDTIVASTEDQRKFMLFSFKTQKWSDFVGNTLVAWEVSPDRKYLYYTTGGNEPTAFRVRFADRTVEMITGLKNLRMVDDPETGPTISVTADGSALFTRDVGTQEVYALTVKWP